MDKQYFTEYYNQEREHWWFRARLEILDAIIGKSCRAFSSPVGREPIILNAGIATGATSVMLEKHGSVTSLEYDSDCCEFVRDKLGISVVNASLTELPFADNFFDLICAFDVIEHIEDHELALQEIFRCLKPQGKVILTVPAFQFLWSEHDVINHHFRRYRLNEFVTLQQRAGFNMEYQTYFNGLLFAPIAAARLLTRLINGPAKPANHTSQSSAKSDFERYKSGGLVNKALFRMFRSEKNWLLRGGKFPVGVSILTVAHKDTTTHT